MKFWRKPLDHDKFTKPKGEVHIIADRCKGCGFCIEFCPTEVLMESVEFNVKGYHPPEVKDPDKCISCKLCELICPDFAIFVISLDDDVPTDMAADVSAKTNSKKGRNTALKRKEVAENA